MFRFRIIVTSLFVVGFFLLPCTAATGHAETVRVGIGFAIPPYVIQAENAGVEVDIIRYALKAAGHEVEFIYLPNLRLPVAFADGKVDCVATNAAYDLALDSGRQAFNSVTTVVFQNFAVTLADDGHRIETIGDLVDKTVLGFNNSVKYLGPDFQRMAAVNEHYSELADQALQVRMLYSSRVDAIISDKRIFRYWRMRLSKMASAPVLDLDREVRLHPIFSPSPRHVAFRDAALRDAFNAGLKTIRKAGVVKTVEARYAGVEDAR